MAQETVYRHLRKQGVSRREFGRICGVLAAAMGFELSPPLKALQAAVDPGSSSVAEALKLQPLVPVIWLELQDCAGCSEALTRSKNPSVVDLVLNQISIEYHETLSAAAGVQAEENRARAMAEHHGKYLLVVEGSVPLGHDGMYCTIGGRTALEMLEEAAAGAAAIISTGNCAAFGGIPKANPNPTEARGVWEVIKDKPVVNIPGCPAIPEVTTGTIAHFLVFGTLPALDGLNRPVNFYGTTIHDRCLRRPFYDAGKFANSFDCEGARKGYCLYKLGCKGPTTYNSCATMKWDGGLSFPIQSGHPCLGCSEPNFWDAGGFYQGQSAPLNRPTAAAAGIAAGVGLAAGVAVAASARVQQKRLETDTAPQ